MALEEMQTFTQKLMEVCSFFFPKIEALRDYATVGLNAAILCLFAISAVTYLLFLLKYQFREKPSLTKLKKAGKELEETKIIKKEDVLPKCTIRLTSSGGRQDLKCRRSCSNSPGQMES